MKTMWRIVAVIIISCILLPSSSQASFREREAVAEEITTEDITEEVRFGREVAARILGRYSMLDNKNLLKYVTLVGKLIAINTNRPELEFHFAVLDTLEVNAYAAPGGYVFVTKGAMLAMKDEDELAAVLAHEIGHIVGKHIVKELQIKGSDQSASAGLARLIGGSSDTAKVAFSQAVGKAMDMLFKDGYKRSDEHDADKSAIMFLAFSNYDPSALSRYLDRIGKMKGRQTEVIDKTHPPTSERVKNLSDTISTEGLYGKTSNTGKTRFVSSIKGLK